MMNIYEYISLQERQKLVNPTSDILAGKSRGHLVTFVLLYRDRRHNGIWSSNDTFLEHRPSLFRCCNQFICHCCKGTATVPKECVGKWILEKKGMVLRYSERI